MYSQKIVKLNNLHIFGSKKTKELTLYSQRLFLSESDET
jgi:hypothetical protein